MKRINKEYLQSAMFGFSDALISTTGVIVGISAGTNNKQIVILAGVVTIMVEAISMGSGQYLSLKSSRELSRDYSSRTPAISGVVMFVAYFLAGLVPLLPVVFLPVETSRVVAIVAALTGLFVLGYFKGKIVKMSPIRSALEILIIGGIATAVGLAAGKFFGV